MSNCTSITFTCFVGIKILLCIWQELHSTQEVRLVYEAQTVCLLVYFALHLCWIPGSDFQSWGYQLEAEASTDLQDFLSLLLCSKWLGIFRALFPALGLVGRTWHVHNMPVLGHQTWDRLCHCDSVMSDSTAQYSDAVSIPVMLSERSAAFK